MTPLYHVIERTLLTDLGHGAYLRLVDLTDGDSRHLLESLYSTIGLEPQREARFAPSTEPAPMRRIAAILLSRDLESMIPERSSYERGLQQIIAGEVDFFTVLRTCVELLEDHVFPHA